MDIESYTSAVTTATNRVPSPRENPVEAGRAAGIASGEARRRKREAGAYWLEALRNAVQEDAERVAKKLLASGNGAAIAAGLQLVREYERGKQEDLRNLDRRTTQLDELCCKLLDDCEAEERRKAALRAEVDALGRERRELERLVHGMRAEIDAAGYDVLDDDEPEGGTGAPAPAAA